MAQIKLAKKRFFEVKVPLTATQAHVYGNTTEQLSGRVIRIDLTKSLRGKGLELKARLRPLDAETIAADIISLEIIPAYIQRAIRKGTDYVEDSFEAETKDARMRIKPFLMTRQRVSRAILRELRNLTKKHLEAHLKIRTSEEIFSEITTNKLQRELSMKLKKIYPLALCEIRKIEIIKNN